MYKWMKKLHMYAGLLSFTAFIVWGIVGVGATFLPAPGTRTPRAPEVRTIPFPVSGTATDQQLTNAMIEASRLPFIQPGRKPQRDPRGRLMVRYFTPNGPRRLVLLEKKNAIRIESTQSTLWSFLNTLHMQSWEHFKGGRNLGLEVKLWGGYNEFSLWAVIFMTLSGVYLWLATRPGLRWTQWTFGAASAAFIAFYFALR